MVKEGIVRLEDEKLEFIHQNFAESFCSKYIFDKLKNGGVQKLLIKTPRIDFKFFHTFFLHSLLSNDLNENKNKHISFEVKDGEIVKKILAFKDIYGKLL